MTQIAHFKMRVEEQVDISSYLSFGNKVSCSRLIHIESKFDLAQYFDENQNSDYLILGGGSNMLIAKSKLDMDVLLMSNLGKEVTFEYDDYDLIKVSAGENWHNLVLWSIENNYGGLENLSLIPGTVGAAPIQNIGAYGVELKDILVAVDLFEIKTGNFLNLHASECGFGYRNSIFKSSNKGQFIITDITLNLKKANFEFNTSYGAIQQRIEELGKTDLRPKDISDIVISIRQSKLPDPKVLGNGGSFFKNPIVDDKTFKSIYSQYQDMPFYKLDDGNIKIPAGWLIEKSGWKGKRIGNVGCYEKQALVLVNYGDANGEELWEHAMKVQNSVKEKFDILLSPEVNLIQ